MSDGLLWIGDNYSVIQTLDNRFGVATEQSLIKTYQNNWITTNDLDNIKALGMNYIRLPFWWGMSRRWTAPGVPMPLPRWTGLSPMPGSAESTL